MSQVWKILLPIAGIAVIGFVLLRQLVVFVSSRPVNLGVTAGRLAPCPPTPNCVSTQASPTDGEHAIAPIAYHTAPAEARAKIVRIVQNMPRSALIANQSDYVHAEFRSRLWGFIDDVEFFFDAEAGLIHFRSAARLGQGDFGVNRARMEEIRAAFDDQ